MTVCFIPLIGVIAVWAFYRALESGWPTAYFTADSATDPIVNRTLPRYALWRLGPVYLGCSAVVITLDRLHDSYLLGAIFFAVGHVMMSFAPAVLRAVRARRAVRPALVLLYVAVTLGTACAAAGSVWTRDWVAPAVPPPADMLQALWLGGFAALMGLVLARVAEARRTPAELVRRSRRELPDDLVRLGHQLALEHMADPRIVETAMLVENLQRPKWVRRLERGKSRAVPAGTYGVMQVHSATGLSDAESVSVAVKKYFAGAQIRGYEYGRDGVVHRDSRHAIDLVADFNPSRPWRSLAQEVLDVLTPDEGIKKLYELVASSTAMAHDGEPALMIKRVELRDSSVDLTVSAAFRGRPLEMRVLNAEGIVTRAIPLNSRDAHQGNPATDTVPGALYHAERASLALSLVPDPTDHAFIVCCTGDSEQGTDTITPACRWVLPRDWRERFTSASSATPESS